MILNLARNGLEAMSREALDYWHQTGPNEIVLYVKDEGHGLDPSIVDKIGPVCHYQRKGHRFGLAVYYSIAARHHATIDFETSPQGTTFYVRFPLLL